MIAAARSLREIAALNSRLFPNCLAGLSDRQARQRIDGHTNHVAFIAAHVVDARYYLARYLGLELENPFQDLLEDVKTVDELTEVPPLGEIRAAWDRVSGALVERIETLTDEDLAAKSEQQFPVSDRTVLGGAAFLLQHESYHVGQLAFLRKHFVAEPMSYA